MSKYFASIRKLFGREATSAPAPGGDRRLAQELIDRGIAAESSGSADEALQCYRKAIEADATLAPAHMNLGIALHAKGELAAAIAAHRHAIALDAGYAVAYYNLGLAQLETGEAAQAEAQFRSALQLRPEFPEAWVGLADALQTLGRDAEALAALDTAIGQRDHYIGALLNAGALLRKMGRLEESEARLNRIDLLALCSAGRHAEAEGLARHMIELWPDYGFGWKVLGAVLAVQRNFEAALPAFQQALAFLPSDAETHHNLAIVLHALGHFSEAEASCRRALELRPEYHAAHYSLGMALNALGRPTDAEASFRRALALDPDNHEAHNNLGSALMDLGRFSEAEASYRSALELKPDFHVAHNNLANALKGLDRLAEAEASYRHALALNPDVHQVHNNLGIVLESLGRAAEAEASFRRALAFEPGYYDAHIGLGIALQALNRPLEAEASFRRALELRPDLYQAHYSLGVALQAIDRPAEAEASYRRALELKPDAHEVHNNLGMVLQSLGRSSDAEASFRRALHLKPDYRDAHSNLVFTLDLLERYGIAEQQAERRRWYTQHAQRYAVSIEPHENAPEPERRLRIGYVSADFRRHSACSVFGPVLLRHDRERFEVICYSGVKREDDTTQRLRGAVDAWHSTLRMPDEALAKRIRSDSIDILVDLSGHTEGNRLLVFARKPAPVQVTAWGHATGTGVKTIDYLLADPVMVAAGERGLFAERVVDLPCCLCYEPPPYLPEVADLPALAGKPFTFGCINRVEKLSEPVIALWGRILSELPDCVLLLKHVGLDDPRVTQRLLRRLADAGIAEQRVRLVGFTPHAEHLKTYHDVDLALDPFPQNGGVSTAEALWMGVPVVALHGTTLSGRISASILSVLGMQEWIAGSGEDYVRIAVQAARELPRLARLRAQLRNKVAESVFGDVQRYTAAVESAYRDMWRRWCAGRGTGI